MPDETPTPSKRERPGFDPQRDVELNAESLKGIAHPLRLRMLGILREEGPATATSLARRMGESSGLTSYHLRQLEAYGFVVEDTGRGKGRERWWKAAHRSSWLDATTFEPSEESLALVSEYLRAVITGSVERMQRWVSTIGTRPPEWERRGTVSDWLLRLTPEETERLEQELAELAARYRGADSSEDVPGAAPVTLQVQVLPRVGATRGAEE